MRAIDILIGATPETTRKTVMEILQFFVGPERAEKTIHDVEELIKSRAKQGAEQAIPKVKEAIIPYIGILIGLSVITIALSLRKR